MDTIKSRLKMLLGLLLLALMAFIMIGNPLEIARAERLSPYVYTNSYTWEVTLDTTVAVKHDTAKVVGTGLDNIFSFTGLGGYSSIEGWIYAEAISCDTGDAAADIVDTTKDSMTYVLYTYCNQNKNIKKIIELDSLIKGGGGEDTVWFTIDADSAICDGIYFNFITAIADSDYSVVRAGAGVTYRVTTSITAKP